jgi:hypothetical protein
MFAHPAIYAIISSSFQKIKIKNVVKGLIMLRVSESEEFTKEAAYKYIAKIS